METKEISDEKINSEIIRDTSDSNSSLIHLEEVNEIIINNNNIEEEMKEFLGTVITKYKFIFIIDMVLMIFFSCYLLRYHSIQKIFPHRL